MPPLTTEQIAAVRACNWQALSNQRYPESIGTNDLPGAYTPQSACDWAVLAVAYLKRDPSNGPISNLARQAILKAINLNPGFAFADPFFGRGSDQLHLVKAPPIAAKEITAVKLQYKWEGLGDSVDYTAEIQWANTKPIITGPAKSKKVDQQLVQALGPALTDLLTVDAPLSLVPCTDNYPDWSVSIQFQDNTTLDLSTHRSNFFGFGGPWQLKIGQQNYVQFSADLPMALYNLVKALDLPVGQPAAMTCTSSQLLDQAFPGR